MARSGGVHRAAILVQEAFAQAAVGVRSMQAVSMRSGNCSRTASSVAFSLLGAVGEVLNMARPGASTRRSKRRAAPGSPRWPHENGCLAPPNARHGPGTGQVLQVVATKDLQRHRPFRGRSSVR